MSPLPPGAACSPSWGAPVGLLRAGATLRDCRAGGTPHHGHLPGAEAVEKHQDAAFQSDGKNKVKSSPCYCFLHGSRVFDICEL